MKRHLGPLSVVGVVLFMAMTVFAGDVFINGTKWGTFTDFHFDYDNGKVEIWGTSSTPPPTTGNTIKGRVYNDTEFSPTVVGIPGVTVTLELSGGSISTKQTDANGYYTFSGLTDGTFKVTPTRNNYSFSPNVVESITFPGAANPFDQNFVATASKYFSISGDVFNKSGGKAAAVVQLKLGTSVEEEQTSTTGAPGYQFTHLLDGLKYTIVATGMEYNDPDIDVTINNADATGINFTERSTTTGQFTAAIKGAYRLDTILTSNSTGLNSGFGYGFKDQCTPGPASVREGGMTYFLADPSWISAAYTTLKFKWYDFSLTKGFKINLYAIDSLDNGTLLNSSNQNQAYFSITKKAGYRYLLEVDTTNCSSGFALGVTWPK